MFKAEKSALLSAIETARGAVERRNTIPILANVIFEHARAKDRIAMRATDLDSEITVSFSANKQDGFAPFTVPALMLHSIVKSMPDGGEITLSGVNGKANDLRDIEVRCGRSRLRLPVLPAEDFPQLAEMKANPFTIDAALLRQALSETAYAVGNEEHRHYLKGVFFERREQGIALVATDGFRLVRRVIEPCATPDDFISALVPTKTVNIASALIPESGEITLAVNDHRIRISYGDTVITSKLVDGVFPDYARVIPRNLNRKVTADRRALIDAARRAGLVATEKTRAIAMSFAPSALKLDLVDNEACTSAAEEIDIEGDVTERLGINHTFLTECLSHMSGRTVEISMTDDPQNIALVGPDDHADDIVIVMKMRA